MLKHVLVPLDGSPLAEKALDAARYILPPGSKITLLTSVERPTLPVYAYPSPDALTEIKHDQESIRHAHADAATYLERLAANLRLNGYSAEIEIGMGSPAELIVERAHKLGVEAIIMSTHGRSGFSRILFGSVTLKVLSATPCAVIVIPNREQQRVEDEQPDSSLGALPAH